jgi:hypothetical protein
MRRCDHAASTAVSRPERVAGNRCRAAARANTCGPVSCDGGRRRAPVSRGRRTATKLGRRSTSASPPRPSTPRLLDAESEPSDATMVLLSNGACRLPQALFNGFLAIKSMRLFALRTVSIGKSAGTPDVSMRSRSLAAAGQAGRRSCRGAGLRPNEKARRPPAAWQTSARPSAVVAGRKADGWLVKRMFRRDLPELSERADDAEADGWSDARPDAVCIWACVNDGRGVRFRRR